MTSEPIRNFELSLFTAYKVAASDLGFFYYRRNGAVILLLSSHFILSKAVTEKRKKATGKENVEIVCVRARKQRDIEFNYNDIGAGIRLGIRLVIDKNLIFSRLLCLQ